MSPTNGPLAGGTAVTLAGKNFPTTIDSVRFGAGRLGNLMRVSATQLTGTTPAGSAAGAVDVTVYTTAAGNGTCTGCFTHNPAVMVSAVIPPSGPLAGGTVVTITGTNFPATMDSVRVGTGRLGGLVRASATQLTGTTTADSTAGPVDVAVYTTSAGNGTCAGCFTYIAWTTLAAGIQHTCGLMRGGAVYCWGNNSAVQLGHGFGAGSSTPVVVTGGFAFVSLTAGDAHTCALTKGGAAYCWGDNSYGQAGDGSTGVRETPAAVAGGLMFASLAVGFEHTCGLTGSGAAYCWGSNWFGELGNGSRDTLWHATPEVVAGGLAFASVTAGNAHTCGVTSGGAAYCWGDNWLGALGDGSTTNRTSPVPVSGGLAFARLTVAWYHTCGVTNGGAAYCWGGNGDGERGDGSTTYRLAPVAVANP